MEVIVVVFGVGELAACAVGGWIGEVWIVEVGGVKGRCGPQGV